MRTACRLPPEKLSRLEILATSREALDIEGETPFAVPSMTYPDPNHLPPLKDFNKYEATNFFLNRAQSSWPEFEITESNAEDVARICKRLDGIPLALELAAARVQVMGVRQIADRLEESFHLLASGFRTALPRHRTMQASIDWSYRLLSEEERILLRKFSVFSGGWDLEAAEAVCADETVKSDQVVDLLSELVNKSLVIVEHALDSSSRYYLQDAIWDFAHAKLAEHKEESAIRNQHLHTFRALAEMAEPNLAGMEQIEWLNRIGQDLPNLRAAMEWALKENPLACLRLAAAIRLFWHIRGNWSEGLNWLERGLKNVESQPKSPGQPVSAYQARQKALLCAKAKAVSGFFQKKKQEFTQAASLLETSLEEFRRITPVDRQGMAYALLELGSCITLQGDYERAELLLNEAMDLYKNTGDQWGISECFIALGNNETNPVDAKKLYSEGAAIKRRIGDLNGLAYALHLLGELTVFETDLENASSDLEESIGFSLRVGNKKAAANDYCSLAWIAWVSGNYQKAIEYANEALAISTSIDDKHIMAKSILHRSDIRHAMGEQKKALGDIKLAYDSGLEIKDESILGAALYRLGRAAWLDGIYGQAQAYLQDACDESRAGENKINMAFSFCYLGKTAAAQANLEVARGFYQQSVRLFYDLNYWYWDYMAYSLEGIAKINLVQKNLEQAARLYGMASRFFNKLPNTLSPVERKLRDEELSAIGDGLGEEELERCLKEGFELPVGKIFEMID